MTAVGSGIASQIVYKAETTYGVAPSLSTNEALEFKSETMELKKTTVQGTGLAAGKVYPRTNRRVLTNFSTAGGIVMDLQTRFIGTLVEAMVGSYGYTLVSPTEIASSGIYKSVHWPTSPYLQGHSLCIQKGVPTADGTVEPFTYTGCKISDWEIAVQTGAIAQLTLSVVGRNELAGASTQGDSLNASVPSLATFNSVPGAGEDLQVFHFREATIYTGGTPSVTSNIVSLTSENAAANVRSVSIKQSVSLDTSRFFVGGDGFLNEPLENGWRSLSGQMEVEWLSSEAMYEAFQADTTTSLQVTLTGPTVGGQTYLFDIIIPNIKLDGETPKVSGPQVVTQAIPFTGLDDETTTPLQITLQNEDSSL
jgi:hypothetical protein